MNHREHRERGEKKKQFWRSWLLLCALCLAGCEGAAFRQTAGGEQSPLNGSLQMVRVISDNWEATTAMLQCYSRPDTGKPWVAVGPAVPVNIGRTGLAWGRGRHDRNELRSPMKREGDGKAPAGVFDLPFAFGYSPAGADKAVKLPYTALTSDILGVDDPKSKYYNQIIRADSSVVKDWNSTETMRRDDNLYEWGVFVNHNASPAEEGAGSCIFLHIWRGPGKPTAGCTSMDAPEMVRLLHWLDPKAGPVLVQLPRHEYRQLASAWGLPAE